MAKTNRKKLGDEFFLNEIDISLRKIYSEDRNNIELMVNNIKDSRSDFDSEFTETEKMMFMERFYSYSESCLNNKIFFLFKVNKGISPAYAVNSLPLRPKKPKTVQVTHVGFNNNWYNVDDFCEIFMEELLLFFTNMKLVTGTDLKSHIYASVSYD